MKRTIFQHPELRDASDAIIQEGTYGKGSPLANSDNTGVLDYINNNLEALNDSINGGRVYIQTKDDLPKTGDMASVYVAEDTGKWYYWNGSSYVSVDNARSVVDDAEAVKEAVAKIEQNVLTSEANAANSAKASATSATASANAASASAQSASDSAASATASQKSADAAAKSVIDTEAKVTEAGNKANDAATSATAAAASANTASLQAEAAATSATTATSKANEATTSASNAAVSAKAAADKYTDLVNVDLTKKADLAGAAFTGKVTAPTADTGTNDTQVATTAFVVAAIAALVNGSPESLDTLNELAKALGNDPNFATTISNLIGTKLDKTGTAAKATADSKGNEIDTTYATKADLSTSISGLAKVASTGNYTDLLNQPAIPSKTSELINDSRYVSTDADGNVTLTGTLTAAKVYNAVYNDYAEFFPRGEETERGDIIAADETSDHEQYVKATDKSKCVVGVQSEEFAQIIGGAELEDGQDVLTANIKKYIPVALAGRVHVKYTGKAVVGTKVVPSDVPGVGRAWQDGDSDENVVGTIVEADTLLRLRLVKILVRG
jgi:hypothetical protein